MLLTIGTFCPPFDIQRVDFYTKDIQSAGIFSIIPMYPSPHQLYAPQLFRACLFVQSCIPQTKIPAHIF
ncbi:hypothetical protein HMPREF3232_01061 [Fannyhessea vaginae]|nr:hypothetical protein HMPREF3232_01061 [Fannyhessea vaginae]